MRVVMCCNKCEEKVREEIGEVYGVQDVLTDQARSEVVVIGFADAHDVLKKAKKVDKRADITASDSFTTHHGRHSHKHNRIHHKHSRRSDGYSSSYPIETISSPRYNASYHQSSYGGPSRYIDGGPDSYRHRQYRPEPVLDGYRSDYQPRHRPTPMYDPEYRAEYDEYRPRYHQGYRPSQDYLPRYVEDRDYPYPEPAMNPDYIHHLDYY
jgi:copper chaperone CopZ